MAGRIHHAVARRAARSGIILRELPTGIEAYWPDRNRSLVRDTAKEALQSMLDEQSFVRETEQWEIEWTIKSEPVRDTKPAEGKSVVKAEFLARYAELGDKKSCGDWLASVLNQECRNKRTTNLEVFEEICRLNGVDLSKFDRTKLGWQGRLRMSGRNILAPRVRRRKKLRLPGGRVVRPPADW